MGTVLLLTKALQPSADVLPGLALLTHQVKILPAEGSALLEAPDHDLLMIDGRRELAHARDLCRLIRTTGSDQPVLLIVTEGGLAVVAADWGMDDVILETAGPAEIDARIRVAIGKLAARSTDADPDSHIIRSGEVVVDEATYTAKLSGRVLDLTFKEFELLKYLAQHPGRVFTRDQLLQEVWGYDYFGGTRTVDVHVRRLRAKLGTEHESLIGTVRNVGYRFVLPPREQTRVPPRTRRHESSRTTPRRAHARHSLLPWCRSTGSARTTSTGRPRTARPRRYAASRAPSTANDGASTLNEQAVLQLKNRGLRDAELWVGERRLRPAPRGHPRPRGAPRVPARRASAPRSRPRRSREGRKVEAWSHADHPGAEPLAAKFGIPRERELKIMKQVAARRPRPRQHTRRGTDPWLRAQRRARRCSRSTRARSPTTPSRGT